MSTSEDLYYRAAGPIRRSDANTDVLTALNGALKNATPEQLKGILKYISNNADDSSVQADSGEEGSNPVSDVDASKSFLRGIIDKAPSNDAPLTLSSETYNDLGAISPVDKAAILKENFLKQAGQGGGSIWGWVNNRADEFNNKLATLNANAQIEAAEDKKNQSLYDFQAKNSGALAGINNPREFSNIMKLIELKGGPKYNQAEMNNYYVNPSTEIASKTNAANSLITDDYRNRALAQQAELASIRANSVGSTKTNGLADGEHDVNIDRTFMNKISSIFSNKKISSSDKYRMAYDAISNAKENGVYDNTLDSMAEFAGKYFADNGFAQSSKEFLDLKTTKGDSRGTAMPSDNSDSSDSSESGPAPVENSSSDSDGDSIDKAFSKASRYISGLFD